MEKFWSSSSKITRLGLESGDILSKALTNNDSIIDGSLRYRTDIFAFLVVLSWTQHSIWLPI
eukprot:11406.XXX_107321_107506_1 [CDS] Oithona nana genome sequencing.